MDEIVLDPESVPCLRQESGARPCSQPEPTQSDREPRPCELYNSGVTDSG